ncbi:hypothetical protein HDU84_002633 [Entophlyctis sp. JEL0112]|nr:hypothetical protein HDU84_002633 [Entophlyctis sp. JEL0112]
MHKHLLQLVLALALVVALLPPPARAVKRADFKTCAQSGFCVRQRAFAALRDLQPSSASYALLASSLNFQGDSLSATVLDSISNARYAFSVVSFADSLRVSMREISPIHPPFDLAVHADGLLSFSPAANGAFSIVTWSHERLTLSFGNNTALDIEFSPFSFSVSRNNNRVVEFNERAFLNYEYQRKKEEDVVKQGEPDNGSAEDMKVELSERDKELKKLLDDIKKDIWEETFNGHRDSKPRGPSSIGFDISFPKFWHVYGLPEHASSFSLKATKGNGAPYSEPYRLYNFDVFEYELDNPMALYGSVPFLMAHRKDESVGVMWLNAAEMWVDVEKTAKETSTHWMAESGILDLLIFLGPEPKSVVDQMTRFTGRSAMPQHFAIGYHQCRWNYLDEQDVHDVDANFDVYDIPYDVLWLDIEHTDGKRYFTWDKVKFAHPKQMQEELAVKGRKMVTIIDPHIKSDSGFSVSKKATDLGLWVKNKDNNDFDGWCWPGTSHWLDYLNPASRKFWAEQFHYSNYEGSTPTLYTWNDMNEPSVFNGPEITMPKDNLHHGGFEHRDVHNLYGSLQHLATAEGHIVRSDNKDRPFVLSRAFFIGTQKYGAIWTGDNTANWDHLAISIPMLLTIGTSGITFCGADAGGFFGNPEPDLLVRWYQAASMTPFFRAHAHIDTKRREPWLFGEPYTSLMRESVRRRYRLLPYLYTLFWEASQSGIPVMRPLMLEFPGDEKTFDTDSAFMLGNALLVHPVVHKDVKSLQVYLPGSSIWYDYDTYALAKPSSTRHVTISTPLEKIPTFVRGGTILPRRDRVRRAANLGLQDPVTLVIAVDGARTASGQMYADDGHTFEHATRQAYLLARFDYSNGVLRGTRGAGDAKAADGGWAHARVERVLLVGVPDAVKSVVAVAAGDRSRLEFSRGADGVIVVKDPKVVVGAEWEIIFA